MDRRSPQNEVAIVLGVAYGCVDVPTRGLRSRRDRGTYLRSAWVLENLHPVQLTWPPTRNTRNICPYQSQRVNAQIMGAAPRGVNCYRNPGHGHCHPAWGDSAGIREPSPSPPPRSPSLCCGFSGERWDGLREIPRRGSEKPNDADE